jgi:hypothetical protein
MSAMGRKQPEHAKKLLVLLVALAVIYGMGCQPPLEYQLAISQEDLMPAIKHLVILVLD